jgi:DNA-binding NtrC family response regulator
MDISGEVRTHVMVVVEDASDERWGLLLTRLLREDGWAAELVLGLEPGTARLAWAPAPKVIVLDVASTSSPLRALLDAAASLAAPPRLIVITDEPDVAREVQSLVSTALPKPIAPAELRRFLGNGNGNGSSEAGAPIAARCSACGFARCVIHRHTAD